MTTPTSTPTDQAAVTQPNGHMPTPDDATSSMLTTALAYQQAGRSVLPIAPGEKRPSILNPHREVIGITWDTYQTTPADEGQIHTWFPSDRLMGIGIACGPVSGMVLDGVTYALEILDVDDEQTLEAFIEAAHFQGLSELLQRLLHQRTPGGAGHFASLCQAWAGNTKLAQRQEGVDGKGKTLIVTLIETRGAGGQAVVAPTPPGIHPEHPERGYQLIRGSWEDVPIITPEERQTLWDLARSFNEYVEPAQVHTARTAGRSSANGNRPGDWLNRTADRDWWRALLERHDWTLVQEWRGIQYWQRPGKQGKSWSATLGACGDYFYVFSSNAHPFQPEHAYLPFPAFALLDHAGDFQAAARTLIPQRFAAEWPGEAVALALLERLVGTPEARLISEALAALTALSPDTWQATKHAIKGLLGDAINLPTLDRDWKKARQRSRSSLATPSDTTQDVDIPTIHITTRIKKVVDAAERAILVLPDGPRLFQRARRLCYITRHVPPLKWLRRPADAPGIVFASAAHLRELASVAAQWMKYDKRTQGWEEALPPPWVADTLLAREGWPVPVLEGIVSLPTLLPDGTLLTDPGYDPATGLFVALDRDYPPIKIAPTLDDARSAIGVLQQPLIDFLFADSARVNFSAALAALLSVVCRYAIQGNVPLFAVTSHTPASGKGLLADALSVIGTGRTAPRWAQPHDRDGDEERKRLMAIALAGDPLILIDNVTRPLGSGALDAALTAGSIKDRQLGTHQTLEAPMQAVFFATGNNMTYESDTARRVVPIALDPQMERPEERTGFQHNPLLPWVTEQRPQLVAAALTILRAYFA